MAVTRRAAVFLDKDGTLVDDVPYNVDPARVTFAAGAAEALRHLSAAGYAMIVVSNQSGVARGLFEASALDAVTSRIRELAASEGARIDALYYCPHHPGGADGEFARTCGCRKPAPGLIRRAAREQALDLDASWLVGDILDDVEAGRRAGCRTLLIDGGGETLWQRAPARQPHYIATGMREAAEIILREDGR